MTTRLPPRVGRYEIKGELGRGKMGERSTRHSSCARDSALRVWLSWDGNERTGTISSRFEAGASRSLVIRLSGRDKALALELR